MDLGFVFFTWASIYFLFRWARGSENISYLLLSAVFCGLGLGTKYNGLIVLLILVCFVPILFIRSGNKNSGKKRWIIGYAVIFSLVALLFFSPWMIRNARLTGNPVYPIFKNLIGTSPDLDQPAVSNLSMKPWVQRKLIYKESVWETVFIPVRIFFQGRTTTRSSLTEDLIHFCSFSQSCFLSLAAIRISDCDWSRFVRFVFNPISVNRRLHGRYAYPIHRSHYPPTIRVGGLWNP